MWVMVPWNRSLMCVAPGSMRIDSPKSQTFAVHPRGSVPVDLSSTFGGWILGGRGVSR